MKKKKVYKLSYGYFGITVDGKKKLLHRYIWEMYNGPIPEGMCIHHINENKACNCIPNLQMMTRTEHMKHHGEHMSDESKQKMSDAKKGKTHSTETKLKISEANKGRIISTETRQKMSETSKGRIESTETRQKISKALRGHAVSSESRQKMSEARKLYYANKKAKSV